MILECRFCSLRSESADLPKHRDGGAHCNNCGGRRFRFRPSLCSPSDGWIIPLIDFERGRRVQPKNPRRVRPVGRP